jgi:glycosyltransferase involved in cell wall biosynthesis
MHFKYFASFGAYVTEEVRRREHRDALFQYAAYADRVERDADLTLYDPEHSVEFRDVRQLLDLGIMRADDERAPFRELRLANIWRAKGKLERAAAGYRAIIEKHPRYVPAHLELGELLTQQGDVAAAERHYRAALAANPAERALADRLAHLQTSTSAAPSVRPPTTTGGILLYTDQGEAYGAQQIGHMLMLALAARGDAVSCAQPPARHHLIAERERAGIRHAWLADDADAPLATVRPDLVIFNDGSPFASLAAKEAAARRGIPYVVVTHCVSPAWADDFAGDLHRLPDVWRRAAAVVAVSNENLALLRDRFGLPPHVGEVILNGRPEEFFAPPDPSTRSRVRAELRIAADAVVVLTAGRLELVKGYQYVLAAMKRLRDRPIWPRLHFMWAGKGTLEGQLRAVVAEHGLADHVTFLGERTDVADLLDASDVFLLASQFEGMPLAIMEAMAKGVATVATEVSGIPEALADAGVLLPDPRADADATVRAIVATLETLGPRPDLRRARGDAGRRRAESLFRADRMVAAYAALVGRCR